MQPLLSPAAMSLLLPWWWPQDDTLLAISPAPGGGWHASLASALLAVLVALWLDRRFGEPPTWCHPVVWMGRGLHALGLRVAPATWPPPHAKLPPSQAASLSHARPVLRPATQLAVWASARFALGALGWCALAALAVAGYAAVCGVLGAVVSALPGMFTHPLPAALTHIWPDVMATSLPDGMSHGMPGSLAVTAQTPGPALSPSSPAAANAAPIAPAAAALMTAPSLHSTWGATCNTIWAAAQAGAPVAVQIAVQGVLLGLLLKPLLAWRMLHDEVLAVELALQHSLQAGRDRLSWLVSRDTTVLDAGAVRESAIETLAENLVDSVIAPLLWFALAGLAGAVLYRFANTADAMWGYPGWRGQGLHRRHWQWAGKWAARTDDALNWLPARLGAALLGAAACLRHANHSDSPTKPGTTPAPDTLTPNLSRATAAASLAHQTSILHSSIPGSHIPRWHALRRDAASTPSPNGGWPMGVMAQALNVRLGKAGVYVLHPTGAVPQTQQLHLALRLAGDTVRAVACAAGVLLTWTLVQALTHGGPHAWG